MSLASITKPWPPAFGSEAARENCSELGAGNVNIAQWSKIARAASIAVLGPGPP